MLAILSGLGGGLIHATLLQHGTPIALTDYSSILTALAFAAVAYRLPVGSGRTECAVQRDSAADVLGLVVGP